MAFSKNGENKVAKAFKLIQKNEPRKNSDIALLEAFIDFRRNTQEITRYKIYARDILADGLFEGCERSAWSGLPFGLHHTLGIKGHELNNMLRYNLDHFIPTKLMKKYSLDIPEADNIWLITQAENHEKHSFLRIKTIQRNQFSHMGDQDAPEILQFFQDRAKIINKERKQYNLDYHRSHKQKAKRKQKNAK